MYTGLKSGAIIHLYRIEIRCYNIGRAYGTAKYQIRKGVNTVMDVFDYVKPLDIFILQPGVTIPGEASILNHHLIFRSIN